MWKPSLTETGKPKYSEIADKLEQDIRSGLLHPGDQLPTHRDLADIVRVNVSTITRAVCLPLPNRTQGLRAVTLSMLIAIAGTGVAGFVGVDGVDGGWVCTSTWLKL